jgi:hypothetical protein
MSSRIITYVMEILPGFTLSGYRRAPTFRLIPFDVLPRILGETKCNCVTVLRYGEEHNDVDRGTLIYNEEHKKGTRSLGAITCCDISFTPNKVDFTLIRQRR